MIYQGGEIIFFCRVCRRVRVDFDGGVCAGCRNAHKGDPEPWIQTIVPSVARAVIKIWDRWWVEILVLGAAIALIVWMVVRAG